MDRAQAEAARGDLAELLDVVGDAAADAAHRERRTDDRGKADVGDRRAAPRRASRTTALRGVSMPISVIASRNSRRSSATLIASTDAPISFTPYLSSVPFSASSTARLSAVWPPTVGSSASGRSRSMTCATQIGGERLDVGAVGQLRVGHDRRRVAVDEHDLEPLGAQRLAGLGAGVVELAGLADDDRAGADDEHAFDVSTLGHCRLERKGAPGRTSCSLTPAARARAGAGPTSALRSRRGTAGTGSPRRAGRATPRDGTARRTPDARDGAGLRPCCRTGSGA